MYQRTCIHLPSPTGNATRGGAWRDGGAGLGQAAWDANGSVRSGDNRLFYPCDHRKKYPERVFGNTSKQRFMQTDVGTTQAVDPLFASGLSARRCQLFVAEGRVLTGVPTHIYSLKPFHAEHVQEQD